MGERLRRRGNRTRKNDARDENCGSLGPRSEPMAKGQEKPKTNNKPKLTLKEKKQKKKEKATSK